MTNKLMSNIEFKQLIEDIRPNTESIELMAEYLGYSVGENPVTEDGSWKILFTDKIDDYSKGVIAIKTISFSLASQLAKLFKCDKIKAVVTAPLNKESLHMGGHSFDGHTEIFATLTNTIQNLLLCLKSH